jgi:RNA-directed DNA polymerase
MKPEQTPAEVPAMDKQAGDAQWRCYGAEPGVWSERMLAALDKGVKGNKWFSLIDKVYADRTLALAWAKVLSNAGACGVDGITVERFGKDSQKRLLAVKEHLKEGSYQPKPVKRVMIPKPGSAQKRPLGIPTVRDRVAQTALRMVIEPIFEKEFAPHSYGFRPGRGCKDALRQVNALLKSGHVHVVDADLKSYFDTIPHQRLMALVAERIADGRVKALIETFLKQGVLEDGVQMEAGEEGTPQGGVISPLLANLYLNPLDWLMADAGFAMVRYADDFVVMCRTPEQARHALEKIRAWTQEVELTLHPEKTRTVDMRVEKSHFDFLGYRFYRTLKGKLTRLVRPKSEQKLRATLKPLTQRNCGLSLEITIRRINPTLKGWYAYFKQATPQSLKGMDSWVRDRLRAILRRRRGWKGKAQKPDRYRWPNRYFRELGLFCLEEAQSNETANLRRGGTR